MYVIGHRGAKGLAPENTLSAFQKALDCKVDEIETDIRVTLDGVAILIHDEIPESGTAKYSVAHTTYAQLLAVFPDLITLEQGIRYVNRRTPVCLEVKPEVALQPIITVITTLLAEGWQEYDFVFASFDFSILQALQDAVPNCTLVVNEHYFGTRATYRARLLGTTRITLNHRALWFGFVWMMHRSGYQLIPYTMNNPAKVRRWQRFGLYGCITDVPDVMKPLTT